MFSVNDNHIIELSLKPSTAGAKSERAELIGTITDRLNLDRTGPYKPLSYKRVAFLLAKIPTKDLYYIRDYKDTKNWAKWFWFSIKPQPKKLSTDFSLD